MIELPLKVVVAILILGGCSEPTDSGLASLDAPIGPNPPPSAGPALDVRDFGATGNDETDDTAAFAAAIRALPPTGGTVLVPAGVFTLRAMDGSPNRAIDLSGRRDITIRGQGMDATYLRMAPGTYQGATHIVLVKDAAGVTLEDLAVDGNLAQVVYHDEQSHGVQIVSSANTRIRRLSFQSLRGDGIRLFGAAQADKSWTERVWIEDSYFRDMRRNGISIQRAARYVQIRGNRFEMINDQSISSEPSGTGAPTDILIEDNIVLHSSGAWAVALAGIRPTDALQRLTFRNNRIEDGGVYFLWVSDLVADNNVIRGDPHHAPLRLQGVSEALVSENELAGLTENGSGVLQVVNDDNALPFEISLVRNMIRVGEGLTGIHVKDALGDIDVIENTIIGDKGNDGVFFTNVLEKGPRYRFRVTGNDIRNFAAAVAFASRGDVYRDVQIQGNFFDYEQVPILATIGILFDRTGPPEDPAAVLSNRFGTGILTRIVVR